MIVTKKRRRYVEVKKLVISPAGLITWRKEFIVICMYKNCKMLSKSPMSYCKKHLEIFERAYNL